MAVRPSLEPTSCEGCPCRDYRWDCAPCVLRTDPPPTCRCGHPASRHRYQIKEKK